MATMEINEFFEADAEIEKLEIDSISASKSQLAKVKNPSKQDVKTMVKLFYQTQKLRKTAANLVRSAKENEEKDDDESQEIIVNAFIADALDYAKVEKNISNQLEALCKSQEVGRWLLSIKGIGPVLAAGLLSYFDVSKAKYATNFISYGGLNDNNRPWLGNEKSRAILNDILGDRKDITDDDVIKFAEATQWKYNYFLDARSESTGKWSKSDLIKLSAKIPYNAELKTLLWKVGKSFEWVKNKPDSLYGKILNERLVYEHYMNDNGRYAEAARLNIINNNIGKDTETYKVNMEGKLTDKHINDRAMRYTTKIFVSHLFEEMYRVEYDEIPPRYYALEHLEGKHNINIDPEVEYAKVSSEKEVPKKADPDKLKLFLDRYLEDFESEEELDEFLNTFTSEMKERKAAKRQQFADNASTEEKPKKETVEEVVTEAPKRRGRPKKIQETPVEEPVVEEPKKKRGRPRKNQ